MKSDKRLCLIPVIMITAVDDEDSMVKCVSKGADDYLFKPFNSTLLTARIKSCLKKKQLQDREREYGLRLEKEVFEKTRELVEAHKKLEILDNAKTDFLRLISHELRTPLNGIIGSGEILTDKEIDEETRLEFKDIFQTATHDMLNILDGALLISEIDVSGDSFHLKPELLKPILDTSLKETESFAELQQVSIDSVFGCKDEVLCDWDLLGKALTSLIKVAVKFSHRGGKINILCERVGTDVFVKIQVNQGSIPDDVIPDFFEIFTSSGTVVPGGDLGLDPPIAERIIKL
ncbi:MAG: hypothetical protein GY941_23250, partial [Planctomycetes bacterium]|nr:hypothetical protein [Planctomycetota bacterium]